MATERHRVLRRINEAIRPRTPPTRETNEAVIEALAVTLATMYATTERIPYDPSVIENLAGVVLGAMDDYRAKLGGN